MRDASRILLVREAFVISCDIVLGQNSQVSSIKYFFGFLNFFCHQLLIKKLQEAEPMLKEVDFRMHPLKFLHHYST